VLHTYLRYDLSVEDNVTENTDVLSQSPYDTIFCHSGRNAGEEAMSVREKY
jgi:hypothetical protein